MDRITSTNYAKLEKQLGRGSGRPQTCLNGHDADYTGNAGSCNHEGCEFKSGTQAPAIAVNIEHVAAAKIVTVCDLGINRSVTLASLLKYRGHDVLSVGLSNNSPATLRMLFDWADVIITTDLEQGGRIDHEWTDKILLFNVGIDNYPRPYNQELYRLFKSLIALNTRV